MGLKMFEFIDDAIGYLEESRSELEEVNKEIKDYFENILIDSNGGYLNINSRVKSVSSLKEKIIRNNYYKKYASSEELISNLSDLIGVRIECRFIQDENIMYKIIKKHFNKIYSDGYYYNPKDERIRLELMGKQPQEQKNGFKIYRIDGVCDYKDKKIRFELQIKSLVNIFWGEIEHKIIYKNNSYLLGDNFLKEIMSSIKKNLSMIDNQLLIIYNQFNSQNSTNPAMRKIQVEKLLSKIIYDVFSMKMKNNLGFIVDFRRACDTIMKYILRSNNAERLDEYSDTMVNTLSRLNDIAKNQVIFDENINFERDIVFKDKFSEIVGGEILKLINSEFQWNLFFRILFEIEPGNNAEDFETFVDFLKNRFYVNNSFQNINLAINSPESESIIESIMREIAYSFVEVDTIDFISEENIEGIHKVTDDIADLICKNISSYEEWRREEGIYLKLFRLRIKSIFDLNIETSRVMGLIEEVKNKSAKIEISESIIKYYDKLHSFKDIKAEEAIKFFKVK